MDGFGMGKYAGIEVMVHQTDGQKRKFLADVPYSIEFLRQQGANLPKHRFVVCNLAVN